MSTASIDRTDLEKMCTNGLKNIRKRRLYEKKKVLAQFISKYKKAWWRKILFYKSGVNITNGIADRMIKSIKYRGSIIKSSEYFYYPEYENIWMKNERSCLRCLELTTKTNAESVYVCGKDITRIIAVCQC